MDAQQHHEPTDPGMKISERSDRLLDFAATVTIVLAVMLVIGGGAYIFGYFSGQGDTEQRLNALRDATEKVPTVDHDAPPLWVHPKSGCVFVVQGAGANRTYTQIEGPDGYAVCNPPAATTATSAVDPQEAAR